MEDTEDFLLDLVVSDEDDVGGHLHDMCINLFAKGELLDCTLACSDGQLQAHRLVLAAGSAYLHNTFVSTSWPSPCSQPVLLLRNYTVADVQSVLEFLYYGKLQMAKSKLNILLEISRELGCISLRKAIETAIQSCGVEMFRRLSGTTDRSESPNEKGGIVIKVEPYDDSYTRPKESDKSATVNRHDAVMKSPGTGLKRQINSQVPPKQTKFLKMPNNMPNITNSAKNGNFGLLAEVANSNSSGVDMQHDNGESFVYTSEDLGMIHMDQDGSDGNESTEESAPVPTLNPLNPPPNLVNIKNIKELMANGIGLNQKMDMKVEEEGVPASCPWCLQVFTNLSLLQRHIKTHVGNYKPFTCEYCHNTFARSAHLKRHLRTHTGEKPYQCSICKRPFARQDKLKVHLERHLQNPKPTTSMTVTSYVPQSQSGANPFPVKIILPVGSAGSSNGVSKGYHKDDTKHPNIANFGGNNMSISVINGSDLKSSTTTASGTTITPIDMPPTPTSSLTQKRGGRTGSFNFLIN